MPRTTFQLRWLLVVLWVGLIYALSGPEFAGAKTDPAIATQVHTAAPQLNRQEVRQVTYFLRKHAHVAVYAALALLLAWAWSGNWPPRRPSLRSASLVLLAVGLIAALDEWHQSFVPGRFGRATDVLIDVAGASLALLALWLFGRKATKVPTESVTPRNP